MAAISSVFGATANAKRVAVSHAAFNLMTAAVAILLLNPLLWAVLQAQQGFGPTASPAVTLAVFHSAFNILGVLLMWPLSSHMVRWLSRRFLTREETDSRPRHLDRNVLALPYFAADAMALEVTRINGHAVQTLAGALGLCGAAGDGQVRQRIVRSLAQAVTEYANELHRAQITPYIAEAVTNLMESSQQYLLASRIASDIRRLREALPNDPPADLALPLTAYHEAVARHLEQQDLSRSAFAESGSASYQAVEGTYRRLKESILHCTARGVLALDLMDALLEYANQVKRASRQINKATERLLVVRQSLHRDPQGQVTASPESEQADIGKLRDSGGDQDSAQAETASPVREDG